MKYLIMTFLLASTIWLAGCTPITYSPVVDVHTNAYVTIRTPEGAVIADNHTEAVSNGSSVADVDAASSATTKSASSHIHRGHPVTNNFVVGAFAALAAWMTRGAMP